MSQASASKTLFVVADLPQNKPTRFNITPDDETLAGVRDQLDLLDLRKVRFQGEIKARGKRDWTLKADLGATVIQPCVATLAPVTSRIDTEVERLFVANFPGSDDEEIEMPEDDRIEPLPAEIDLIAVLSEALALNLPLYPRADDAGPVEFSVTEPGKKPMTDEDARPFAGLGALRDQLQGDKDDT